MPDSTVVFSTELETTPLASLARFKLLEEIQVVDTLE